MGSRDRLKLGDYNVICDKCGAKYKASECCLEEDLRGKGLLVCSMCFDGYHPQDFIRVKSEKMSVPIVRPIPPYRFVT